MNDHSNLKSLYINSEQDLINCAGKICQILQSKHINNIIIFLQGPLGAGKTTFTRGFLKGLNYDGPVKSPTYTLVEPYTLKGQLIYHMDLYRLEDEQSLEDIGIRDMIEQQAYFLIEWPKFGEQLELEPDLMVNIAFAKDGRELTFIAKSHDGNEIIQEIF